MYTINTPLSVNFKLKGRYTILRFIGGGRMGAVYLAQDILSGINVAIKQSFLSDNEELYTQFLREAQLLNKLDHRGLPKVLDYFEEQHDQYMVMSFISGRNLRDILKASPSPLSQETVLNWAAQLLDILEYLHAQPDPIVHRDIKPQNIKVSEEGQVYLLDFGIAKGNLHPVISITPGNTVLGFTEDYSPLEQVLRAEESLRMAISPLLTPEESRIFLDSFSDPRSDI